MTEPSGTFTSVRMRSTSSIVSATGISSGVVTTFTAVIAGSASSSDSHCVCVRSGPTSTRSRIASAAPSWATMCPVAAASTTTRSKSARPSIDSRTSHTILPIVRISFTPGAAVATKSRARASGPMRPMTGTCRLRRRYSCSDASVSIAIASTPGWISFGREPDGRVLELRGDVALGVDLDEQDPLADARREERGGRGHRALAHAAFPREEEELSIEQLGRGPVHGGGRLLARAEADLARTGVGHDLDVRDLVDRHADPATLLVGEPEERVALRRSRPRWSRSRCRLDSSVSTLSSRAEYTTPMCTSMR